jgi:hypothetical protein
VRARAWSSRSTCAVPIPQGASSCGGWDARTLAVELSQNAPFASSSSNICSAIRWAAAAPAATVVVAGAGGTCCHSEVQREVMPTPAPFSQRRVAACSTAESGAHGRCAVPGKATDALAAATW